MLCDRMTKTLGGNPILMTFCSLLMNPTGTVLRSRLRNAWAMVSRNLPLGGQIGGGARTKTLQNIREHSSDLHYQFLSQNVTTVTTRITNGASNSENDWVAEIWGLQWVTVIRLLLMLTAVPVCHSACMRVWGGGGGMVHARLIFSEHVHQRVIWNTCSKTKYASTFAQQAVGSLL
jgi:hypothetical protein